MKRLTILYIWLLGILLVLPSCQQDRDPEEVVEDEYVTLTLEISADEEESDDLRNAGVEVFYGYNDGVNVNFRREDGGKTRTVRTIIQNGDNEIFNDDLEWTITNLQTLTYKGTLKIKAKDLANAQKLMIYASTGSTYKFQEYTPLTIDYIRGNRKMYLDIPFFMVTEVKRQGNKLVIKDHENAKFRPKGYIVVLHVKNSMQSRTAIHKIIGTPFFTSFWNYSYSKDGKAEMYMFPNGNPISNLTVKSYGSEDDDADITYDSVQISTSRILKFVFWANSVKFDPHTFETVLDAPDYFPVFGQILGMAKRRNNNPIKEGSLIRYDLEYKLAEGFNPNINNVRPVGFSDAALSNTFYLSQAHRSSDGVDMFAGDAPVKLGTTYMPVIYENINEPDVRYRLWFSADRSPSVLGTPSKIPALEQLSYYIPYLGGLRSWPSNVPHLQYRNSVEGDPNALGVEEVYKHLETVYVGNVSVPGTSIFKNINAIGEPSAVYAIRLKDTDYRVFQRWTSFYSGGEMYFAVSFLKYNASGVDESALYNSPVFTDAYWTANQDKVQSIIFPSMSTVHSYEPQVSSLSGKKSYSEPFSHRTVYRIYLRSFDGRNVSIAWDRFGPTSTNLERFDGTQLYTFKYVTLQ